MWRRIPLLTVLLLAVGAAPVRAQARSCTLEEFQTINRSIGPDGQELIRVRGPARFRCPGGTVIRADSATSLGEERQFFGRVSYVDTVSTVTADYVRYLNALGRVEAHGNVVLTDLKTGSVVRGPVLNYQRPVGGVESSAVFQGRPHATLRRSSATAAVTDTAALPLEVDADLMEMRGERVFRAFQNVQFTRGTIRGSSGEASYERESGRVVLHRDAHVVGERFDLRGVVIEMQLLEEQVEEVRADGEAVLTSEDLRLEGPRLRLGFREGLLHRLVALGEPTVTPLAPREGLRARAIAEGLRLWADSLDVLAPGEQVEQVVAVGNAFAERTNDSITVALPTVVANDWVAGDTITGYFAQPTPTDTGRADAVLERIVAVRGERQASSVYRQQERATGSAGAVPAIYYIVADRFTLFLRNGEVSDLDAQGEVRGMHLQPSGQGAGDSEESDPDAAVTQARATAP